MELFKEKNKTITFTLDGNEYEFYFNEPQTEDRIKYLSNTVNKIRGKISNSLEKIYQNKFDSICSLITGFPEEIEEGKPQFVLKGKPISSDPDSPNYNENWKELVLPNFINQIIVFSTKVFEGIDLQNKSTETIKKLIEESEVLDDSLPLESTSKQH